MKLLSVHYSKSGLFHHVLLQTLFVPRVICRLQLEVEAIELDICTVSHLLQLLNEELLGHIVAAIDFVGELFENVTALLVGSLQATQGLSAFEIFYQLHS